MSTPRLLAIPLTLIALLALAGAALAGGWASVTMSDPPSDITPGEEATVEMTVLQHGVTPIDWTRLTVVATNADSGDVVRADATPVSGKLGHYRASLTFPADGEWTITYDSRDLVMDGTATFAVVAAPPVAAAPPAAANTPAVTAPAATPITGPSLLPAALVSLAVLTALVIIGTFAMRRRSQPVASRG